MIELEQDESDDDNEFDEADFKRFQEQMQEEQAAYHSKNTKDDGGEGAYQQKPTTDNMKTNQMLDFLGETEEEQLMMES